MCTCVFVYMCTYSIGQCDNGKHLYSLCCIPPPSPALLSPIWTFTCIYISHSATARTRASKGGAKNEGREINPLSIIDEAYAQAKKAHELKLRTEDREKAKARRAAAAKKSEARKSLAKLNNELGIANSQKEVLAAAEKPAPAFAHTAKQAATASKAHTVVEHVAAPKRVEKAEINPLAVIEQALIKEKNSQGQTGESGSSSNVKPKRGSLLDLFGKKF